MVYPTLIAAVSDASQPRDRARLWLAESQKASSNWRRSGGFIVIDPLVDGQECAGSA
jgi:hypothetical protein